MKILTQRNNKDYYDYLSGIYGVDEKVVYDRRQCTLLSTLDSPIFNYCQLKQDEPKKKKLVFEDMSRKSKLVEKYVATQIFNCMLEIGLTWYIFKVERYLDASKNVCIDWKFIKTIRIRKSQRLSSAPTTFYKDCLYRDLGFWMGPYNPEVKVEEKDAIVNPILKNTPIVALIPSQDIYVELSTYLSSLNDIEIADTRTDEQKAESAGFDRKTSFRNIK